VRLTTVGEMKKMIKKLTIFSIVLIILVAVLWINDVVSDRKHAIAVLKTMALLEKAPQNYPAKQRIR
jgi:ABC-type lipoprotein release transport system permease subunit